MHSPGMGFAWDVDVEPVGGEAVGQTIVCRAWRGKCRAIR